MSAETTSNDPKWVEGYNAAIEAAHLRLLNEAAWAHRDGWSPGVVNVLRNAAGYVEELKLETEEVTK